MNNTNKIENDPGTPIVHGKKAHKDTVVLDSTNYHSGKYSKTEKRKSHKHKSHARKSTENHPLCDRDGLCFLGDKELGNSTPKAMKGMGDIYVYAVQSTANPSSKPDMEFIIYIPIDSDNERQLQSRDSTPKILKEHKSPTPNKPQTSFKTTPDETKLNYKVPVKLRRPTGLIRKSEIPSSSDESEDSVPELKSSSSKRAVTFDDK